MTTILFVERSDGELPEVRAGQELGDESPLHLEDGHARVEDDDAAALLIRRRADVHDAAAHPDGDSDYFADVGACQAVKGDGEVCGRGLPCQYHNED